MDAGAECEAVGLVSRGRRFGSVCACLRASRRDSFSYFFYTHTHTHIIIIIFVLNRLW